MVSTRSQTRSSTGTPLLLNPSKPKKRCSMPCCEEGSAKRNKSEQPLPEATESPKRHADEAELPMSPEDQQPLEEPQSPVTMTPEPESERPESPDSFIDVVGLDDQEEHEYNVVNDVHLEDLEEPVSVYELFEYAEEPEEPESFIVVHEEEVEAFEVVDVIEDDEEEEPESMASVVSGVTPDSEMREYTSGEESDMESEEESESEEDESDSDDDEIRPIGALQNIPKMYFWNKSLAEIKLMKEYYRLREGENLRRTLRRLIDLDAPYSLFRLYHVDYHAQKLVVQNGKWRRLVEELCEKIQRIKPKACRNLKNELLEMMANEEKQVASGAF